MTAGAGVRAIAGAAADAALDRAEAEAEQLELLPSRFARGSEDHDVALDARDRGKAGRPLGARNLASRQTVDLVRRLFGCPMMESARWLLHSPETLARELKCSLLEAFDRQEDIRKDLRRYAFAPMAAVDASGQAVPQPFQMFIGGREVHVAGLPGSVPPWVYEGGPEVPAGNREVEQNQALVETDAAVSHDPVSHEDAK